jgi:hypothetical protein
MFHQYHMKHLVVSSVIMKFLEHIIEHTFFHQMVLLSAMVLNQLTTFSSVVAVEEDMVERMMVVEAAAALAL